MPATLPSLRLALSKDAVASGSRCCDSDSDGDRLQRIMGLDLKKMLC